MIPASWIIPIVLIGLGLALVWFGTDQDGNVNELAFLAGGIALLLGFGWFFVR